MGNFTKGNMVLELRNVITEWEVLGDNSSGEPGNSFILNIDMNE